MGRTLTLFIAIISTITISSHEPLADVFPITVTSEGLVGPVKSVRWEIQEFDMVDGEKIWRSPRLWRSIEFGKDGKMSKETLYSGGRVSSEKTFEKNETGILAVTEYSNISGEKQRFFRQYNAYGKILREWTEDGEGNAIKKWAFYWDEKDRKDDVFAYDADGSLRGQAEWFYDERFRVIRKQDVSKNEMEVLYEYDDRGRIKRKEQIQYSRGDRHVFIFEDGREISHETFDLDKHLKYRFTYNYENDNRGNWVKQIEIAQPIPGQEWAANEAQRKSRTIEYY